MATTKKNLMIGHDKIFHQAAGSHLTPSNLDANNSGGAGDWPVPAGGTQVVKNKRQFNTPIQPTNLRDPRYPAPDKNRYDDTMSKVNYS